MRQIDNMTPSEIDTLKLKGMITERRTVHLPHINKTVKVLTPHKTPPPPDLCKQKQKQWEELANEAIADAGYWKREAVRLRDELPLMRKENLKLMNFLRDAAAFIRFQRLYPDKGVLDTMTHDTNGLANDEPCFLPRVTGYAKRNRKENRMKAIYKGKLYRVGDNLNEIDLFDDVEAEGTGTRLTIPYSTPDLIIDPTDDEINNILPDYE
jgi:hypothetical protein